MDKHNRIVKWISIAGLISVFIFMIFMDIKAVKYVQAKDIESYSRINYFVYQKDLNVKELTTEFQPVGPKIQTIQGHAQVPGGKCGGDVIYRIEDVDGNIVLPEQKVTFSKIYNPEDTTFSLDVSGAQYDRIENHKLIVKFELDEIIKVNMDNEGMEITQYYKATYQKMLLVFLALINIAFAILTLLIHKYGLKPVSFFALLMVLGIFMCILKAPVIESDEMRHFLRTYDLSKGGDMHELVEPVEDAVGNLAINPEGLQYMIDIPKDIFELTNVDYGNNIDQTYAGEGNVAISMEKWVSLLKKSPDMTVVSASEAATAYLPAYMYWPQTLFAKLAELFKLRPLYIYYFARFGQMLVVSIILALAMYLMGENRRIVCLIGGIYLLDKLVASCNPDGFMIAEIILAISLLINIRNNKLDIIKDKKAWIFMLVYLFILYGVLKYKMPYALFLLGMIFLLGKDNFRSMPWEIINRHKIITVVSCSIIVILLIAACILKKDVLMSALYVFIPQWHMEYLMANRHDMFYLFAYTARDLMTQTWNSLTSGYWIPYSWVMLIVTCFSKRVLGVVKKILLALFICVMVMMIVLVGYTLTPPDYGYIWGITYRYIYPFLPAILLFFTFGSEKTDLIVEKLYPYVYIPGIFSYAVWLIMV